MLSVSEPERAAVVEALASAGCVFAREEAHLLLRSSADAGQLQQRIARRIAGEPLEQVIGYAEFAGIEIKVRAGVFVPRRRTALVVREAVARLAAGDQYVDLCTGSGAIAAAVRARRPDVHVVASDIDARAVACARSNLPGCLVPRGDLFAALPAQLRARVQVLTVSAPYVPDDQDELMPREARDFEPASTRLGGVDGLDVLRRVIDGLAEWLTATGTALLEIGAAQRDPVSRICREAGFDTEAIFGAEGGYAVRVSRRTGRLPSGCAGHSFFTATPITCGEAGLAPALRGNVK